MQISSEEQFIELIKEVHAGHTALPPLKFSGWPSMAVSITGQRYNATLTPSLLQGLLDFQTEFYRAYAQVRYGSPNLQRLTNEEKQQLELLFTVKQGSTESGADASSALNHIFENLGTVLDGMDGPEKLALYIAIVLGVSGYFILNRFWTYKENVTDNQAQTDALDIQRKAVVEALQAGQSERAQRFIEHSEAGYSSIVRAAPDATAIACGNHNLSRDEIAELTNTDSVRRRRVETEHTVLVDSIKKSLDTISFAVSRTDRDNSFTVKADRQILTNDELDKLYQSLKSNRPIRIQHYALMDGEDVAHSQFMSLLEEQA